MEDHKAIRLTTHDLMERWRCSYECALAFMHRRGSGAIKIGRQIVVDLTEVERYEKLKKVRTG